MGDAAVYGSAGSYAHAVDMTTGERLWRYGGGRASYGQPVESDGVVYAAGTSYIDGAFLIALDSANGEVLWRVPTGYSSVDLQPVVSGGRVVAGSYYGLVALNPQTGAEVWRFTYLLSSAPVVSDGVVYVGAFDGSVHALDAASGEPLLSFRSVAPGYVAGLSVAGDVVYAASQHARLYAIDTRADADDP
ncbi:MAG: PQQ-binding-like beta-propeller repeat protein [Chloroflexota bacterium]|nr:PQQ-binding-like beta-propeller repeat protein [Chloroflexota bacterium]